MNKTFIVGLPRTGTTSVCSSCLDMGFRVAHTAYTQQSFEQAEVIADTPVYCDYPYLDKLYPESKYIYLQRSLDSWLPSIQSLLERIVSKYRNNPHAFHPLLIHSFENIFGSLQNPGLSEKEHLIQCYSDHEEQLQKYFMARKEDFLSIDISHNDSFHQLVTFLKVDQTRVSNKSFPKLNSDGQISAWDKIRHPLKIGANERGKNGRRYFDYFTP